jgi:hypothetical protein
MASIELMVTNSKPQNIKGWLLIIAFALMVASPIKTFFNLLESFQLLDDENLITQLPGIATVVYVDSVLSVGLVIVGIIAGYYLWTVKPNAIHYVKKYLLVLNLYHIIAMLLPLTAGGTSMDNEELLKSGINDFLKTLLLSSLCFFYFMKSNQVKSLFFETST